jgi:hypothetical protein
VPGPIQLCDARASRAVELLEARAGCFFPSNGWRLSDGQGKSRERYGRLWIDAARCIKGLDVEGGWLSRTVRASVGGI